MPSASRRDADREEVDGELLTVYGGDSLDAAMAAAAAGHGRAAEVRKARRVKQGVRGLLGKERYEVLVAGEPLPPPPAPVEAPKDVDSALDLLLERADAAEEQAAAARRPAGGSGAASARSAAAPAGPAWPGPARPASGQRQSAEASGHAAASPHRHPVAGGGHPAAAPGRPTSSPGHPVGAPSGTRPFPAGRPAPPPRPRAAPAADPAAGTSPPPVARTALPPVAALHPAPDIAVHEVEVEAPRPAGRRPTAEDVVRPSRYGRRSSDRGGPVVAPPPSGYGRRIADVLDAEVVDEVEQVVGATGRPVPAGPGDSARTPAGGRTDEDGADAGPRRRPSPGPQGRPRRAAPRAALPAAVFDQLIPPAPSGAEAGHGRAATDVAAAGADPRSAAARAADPRPAAPAAASARSGTGAPSTRAAASKGDPRPIGPPRVASPAAGDGWSRAALRALGVPAAVLSRLPAEDPGDDLAWLAALGAAISAVVPPPAEPGPEHPVVVSGHGLEGAVALLEAGASGVAPGTLTIGDRTVPATAAEIALVVRTCVLG